MRAHPLARIRHRTPRHGQPVISVDSCETIQQRPATQQPQRALEWLPMLTRLPGVQSRANAVASRGMSTVNMKEGKVMHPDLLNKNIKATQYAGK